MSVTYYFPSSPLNAYIKCFWYSATYPQHLRLKVLPLPSLHLMVNFADAFHVYEADHAKPFATCAESWLVGLWSGYHIMDTPQDIQILNVSFKPGGAYPFLRLPLCELHNQMVSLDTIWGQFAAEIRERLYAAPTIQARFALMERLLLARLYEAPQGLNTVQYAVGQIARHHGLLSIGALSDLMGISQKHLITQFKTIVGGTPKELARLYRFRHVLQSIDPTHPVDWMRVARQSRYYDLSHFNKDFKAFTGHSPTEYLPLRTQIHVENLERIQQPLDHLPTG
jgi:AraC-like DNA-binding protein